MKPKLLVILGPTASGKSTLAVTLAKQFNGEIISADSRQIYHGLDIGTGKVSRDPTNNLELGTHDYLHAGVPHHLLDVAEPSEYFSVADFKKLADAATADITQRNKLPICVGGTGQYIQAIVDNVVPPEVPPDKTLRRELAGKSAEELFDELKRLDPARAKTIERDNPRRLIRAIEVARALGGVPETDISFPANYDKSPYDALQIGLDVPIETLTTHIHERVQSRLNNGWQQEVQNLLRHGITPEQLGEFGLGYSIIAGHITNSVSMEKLVEEITAVERRYAKRQLRWFKRDPRIQWFNPNKTTEITTTVQKFLRS